MNSPVPYAWGRSVARPSNAQPGLRAAFPPQIASHSARQDFYFGPDRLLRRHDYHVDVAGGFAAAQYVYDYAEADGIVLPTKRRAYRRDTDGRPLLEQAWFPSTSATFASAERAFCRCPLCACVCGAHRPEPRLRVSCGSPSAAAVGSVWSSCREAVGGPTGCGRSCQAAKPMFMTYS